MKNTLNLVIDHSMDATATTIDCQEHVQAAKGHDQQHDACMERLRDHLTMKNDQAGLVLWQKAMKADDAEDAQIYGAAVEHKLIKSLGYVTKISRFCENGIKLVKAVSGGKGKAA